MTSTLFHTAEVHVASFDALRDRIAPGKPLAHVVRPDWLAAAQDGVSDALAADITDTIARADGPSLCTCTTIGHVAATAGAIRIDAPMMAEAARRAASSGGPLLMAHCLQSTLGPSTHLLDSALETQGCKTTVHTLDLGQFWPLFEAGEHEAFTAVIASAIRENAGRVPDLAAIILAQASMAGAAERLADMPVPVLSSPELALRAVLSLN